MNKTGASDKNRCPGASLIVHRTDEQERKLGVECPVLIGHVSTDESLPDIFYLLTNTEALLNFALTPVKGRRCR
jgi:hypothetical protein